MIKLAVFDWNGTIISDTNASVAGTGAAFSKLGLGKMTLKRHQDTFDVPVYDLNEFLVNIIELKRDFSEVPMKVTYHDSCGLGRLSEPWHHWEGDASYRTEGYCDHGRRPWCYR